MVNLDPVSDLGEVGSAAIVFIVGKDLFLNLRPCPGRLSLLTQLQTSTAAQRLDSESGVTGFRMRHWPGGWSMLTQLQASVRSAGSAANGLMPRTRLFLSLRPRPRGVSRLTQT